MSRQTTAILILLGAILVIGGYAAWSQSHNGGAEQTVQKFYKMWTESSIHPYIERSYHGSPYLSKEVQRKLDRLGRGYQQGDFDAVICGHSMPASYSVSFIKGDKTHPTLGVDMHWKDATSHATVTVLKQADGTWLIDGITCDGLPVDQATADSILNTEIATLSPDKAVLGGTWRVTKIDWTNASTATVTYEDGHIQRIATAVFVNQNGQTALQSFTLQPEAAQ